MDNYIGHHNSSAAVSRQFEFIEYFGRMFCFDAFLVFVAFVSQKLVAREASNGT